MTVERMLPLYEGKMGWQYDHRYASFFGTGQYDIAPNEDHSREATVLPRYWVREEVVEDRLSRRTWGTDSALLGFRRVARNTDERTVVGSMVPFGAASYGWILSAGPDSRDLAFLLAQYNSFAFDFVLRQFLSQPSIPQGTFEQLPILPRHVFENLTVPVPGGPEWIIDRVAILVGSGAEIEDFVRDLGRGHLLPIQWLADEREHMVMELDALMFHLFGVDRGDIPYILDSFHIVKRKDEAKFGSFRTKELILKIFDAMREAIDSGEPYVGNE